MAAWTEEERGLYRDYRELCDGDLLVQALRNAIMIFFLLQTFVFIPADYVIYPEHFWFFLYTRLALNALLCVVYFGTSRRFPIVSSGVVCIAGGAMFLAMLTQTGGVTSGYYVGMILLVIGMGVMSPLSARQAFVIASILFAGYAALPLYTEGPTEWMTFALHLFFLGAACLESVWACAYVDRIRFADYTQQQHLKAARDELAELDKAKSRFSANIHHELRTPLTLILAPLDAMRSGDLGPLPDVVQQTLSTMHANGRRLYKMINNLLDLAKVESSQFKVHRRPMELEPLVRELVTGARALAERKGVELVMEGFDVLPSVNADPEALDKVLVNLVGNALKFTDDGDRIRVTAQLKGDAVEMAVIDTGIGIPPDKLGSVFDRFAQVDGSATRRHEGTGIGLSLAKEMIELHGGRIWAESEGEGHGATMRLVLPIGEPDESLDELILKDDSGREHGIGRSIAAVEADLNLEVEQQESDPLAELDRSVTRYEDRAGVPSTAPGDLAVDAPLGLDVPEVLIAEDNPDMRGLLKMLVGREFRVRTARNGREAFELLRESPPDLVLSDVMMPEMSGLELCAAIKQDPETSGIPVVLVTSKAEGEMKIEGLELGADDYVTKPFHPRELMARVRSLVRVLGLQKQLTVRNSELERALAELKQAEVQLVQSERLAAVGELAAGIAHEVNNPVNFALNAVRAMQGTVDELRAVADEVCRFDESDHERLASQVGSFKQAQKHGGADEMADTLHELAEIVGEGLKRTHSLVGDLRDFAVPGRVGETSSEVDVEKGLRSTIQLLRHTLSTHDATVELEIEPDVPHITGDASGLNQVFLNLIKNAAEAMGKRGGRIDVTLSRVDDDVVVVIEDDGPGIPEEHVHRLFEPFFTTKPEGEGTGLGLSISRQIVMGHGGELTVQSQEGQGARFEIRLPIAGVPQTESTSDVGIDHDEGAPA